LMVIERVEEKGLILYRVLWLRGNYGWGVG